MPTGIPFNPDKDDVINALKSAKGVVTYAAQIMKISRFTLHKYIQENEDVKEILEHLRFDYDEEQLDQAENVIHFAMSQRNTDLASSLKAAFYYLNNKGKKRGYSHAAALQMQSDGTQSNIQEIAVEMKKAHVLITKTD